jgi:ankyrin repeat protein
MRKALLAACAALLLAATPAKSAISAMSGESSIADAAMQRDAAAVRTLIKQGADVNAAQGDGMTALHWAAMQGDAELVKMLVAAGARTEVTTRNGAYAPLHLAARVGNAAAVSALLDAGANVRVATTSGGTTALHFAAANGDRATVLALLNHKAPVDARDNAFMQTPVMWAAAYDRAEAVTLLAERGADLTAFSRVDDISAQERAERAALTLRAKRIAALKAAEAPPLTTTQRAQAAKDSVARRDSLARADSIASVASIAKSDTTKGARAARGGRASGAGGAGGAGAAGRDTSAGGMAIGTRGASYGELVGDKGGLTPLLFAVRQGNAKSVEALLKAGAGVNQRSLGDHTSPLLMATINGQFDLASMLLAKGADPKLAADNGATPLFAVINAQWAPKSLYPQPTAQQQQNTTHLQLMEALLKAGADPNVRLKKHIWYMSYNFDLLGVNTQGATPFWRAAYGLDVPAMKLLMRYGADPNIPTEKPVGRLPGDDAPAESDSTAGKDPSGLPPIPVGGPGVYPLHAASGVGYGEGYAANSHVHAPDAWIPAMKYLIEEQHADPNLRDYNGYNPMHHAAARGDNELIQYLLGKGTDVTALSRKGQTTADMANGPVQRIPPFVETVALLEKLGSKNSHKCKSC